ncbi:MAG TPA: protein-glutamate O-methyltransferase CheR [Telluria sp.]|nr:protein-glutamate O-methyltransferase CheR [Telluria sp.]
MLPDDDTLSPARLRELAQLIERQLGLAFDPEDERQAARLLLGLARERGESPQASLEWLTGGGWDAEKTARVANLLTVAETYFFREARAYDLIVDLARKRMTRGGTPLRIWSAGCCTGEEAYSAAIALREHFPAAPPDAWQILGTDINEPSIARARAGVYRDWSFRGAAEWLRERYFEPHGPGEWRLAERVRAQVRFDVLNLATPVYPRPDNGTAELDVILCRNVLMYFTPAQRRAIVGRMTACLRPEGWLVVSPSEASAELFAAFEPVYHRDAVHYRLRGAAGRESGSLVPAAGLAPTAAAAGSARSGRAPPAAVPAAPPRPGPRAQHLSVPAPSARDSRAAALREQAGHAVEQRNFLRARRLLQQLLYLEPEDIAGLYLMGLVLEGGGSKRAAHARFAAAARLLANVPPDAVVPGVESLPAADLRTALRAHSDTGEGRS